MNQCPIERRTVEAIRVDKADHRLPPGPLKKMTLCKWILGCIGTGSADSIFSSSTAKGVQNG